MSSLKLIGEGARLVDTPPVNAGLLQEINLKADRAKTAEITERGQTR